MANTDVKVREIRLLESYSNAYSRFMQASIALSYRFKNSFGHKDAKAHEYMRRIQKNRELIQQKLIHAKEAVAASMKRGGGMDGKELMNREQDLRKYQLLYQKAQQYEEISKQLYQKVHAETERMAWQSNLFRHKLEQSKEEGEGFLNKAISALNSYIQSNG